MASWKNILGYQMVFNPWLNNAAVQQFSIFGWLVNVMMIPSILKNNKCFPGAAIKPLNGVSLATQPVEAD